MGLIENILGLPSEINRPNKTGATKKSGGNKSAQKASGGKQDQVVKTEISDKAKEMLALKNEAASMVDKVKQAETLSTEEIGEIKQRISSQYYFDSAVIDKIVDRLLRTVKVQHIK
ncbi:hypothetical protein DRI50_02795 [candidate division KSB1 bacterium]|nr:MAG: hypothetical protein DRI50_02795 [candidate division KSB1 bacterium]